MIMASRWLRWSPLLFVLLVSGCASDSAGNRAASLEPPLFHEARAVDLLINFPGWEAVSITKPDTSEGGFLPFYHRAEAEQALARLNTRHNLAVVICGFCYSPEEELEQQAAWKLILGNLGYRRIVFTRATREGKLNGSPVICDLRLTSEISSSN